MANRLKALATPGRDEERATIGSDFASGLSILKALVDDGNVQSELGLDADLKSILDPDKKDVPALGLGISPPLSGIVALKHFKEG